MIISIKPWLEVADGSDLVFGRVGRSGMVELNSDAEMEDLLNDGGRLMELDCVNSLNRMDFYHEPVLAREVLEALRPSVGKQIYDGTLGGGGHSELLLANGAHVIGSDQDEEAIIHATSRLNQYGDQFLPIHGNFRKMDKILESVGIDKVDGVLLDLGVSSRQLDEAGRGFSFRNDGPLDMRMDRRLETSAADLVNEAEEEELIRIFREYGEERRAKKIARAIVAKREGFRFERTSQLAELVESVKPKTGRSHPATKVFQALRIAVNNELDCLETVLTKAINALHPGGVLAVITFHSLEDRMVKQFMRSRSEKTIDRPEWPEPRPNPDYCIDLPRRKPTVPCEDEIECNPRARSAKLRVAIKV